MRPARYFSIIQLSNARGIVEEYQYLKNKFEENREETEPERDVD